jgi:hypothetical protein
MRPSGIRTKNARQRSKHGGFGVDARYAPRGKQRRVFPTDVESVYARFIGSWDRQNNWDGIE